MPRAQSAYLLRKDVPARKDLQKAIDGLKFKVTLDDGYAPFKSSAVIRLARSMAKMPGSTSNSRMS